MTVPEYRTRLTRMTAQLERVNKALSRWDEFDCQVLVPLEFRREVRHPILGREALKGLQAVVIGEMERLDIEFQAGMPFSLN